MVSKITAIIETVPIWGDENFDANVHENFLKLKELGPQLNKTVDEINKTFEDIDTYTKTASNKAGEAAQSASDANKAKQTATQQAEIATTKAGEAAQSASTANSAKQTATQQAEIATTKADEVNYIKNEMIEVIEALQSDPLSIIASQELAKKVDKVSGKELSSNDFTTNEKNKLAGIESGAQANVIPTWNSVTGKPEFNENGFSFKKGYLTNGQIVSIDLVGITNINTINTNSIYSVHSRLTSNLPETGINGTLETLVNNQTIIITQVLINVNSKIFIRKGNKNTQVWDAWVEK